MYELPYFYGRALGKRLCNNSRHEASPKRIIPVFGPHTYTVLVHTINKRDYLK